MSEKIPVGVLLIHGIGKQAKGDTLLDFSEPLYHWIDRWLKEASRLDLSDPSPETSGSGVKVVDINLQPSGGTPAHAEWLLKFKPKRGKIRETRWLLAEAWWAESNYSAGFGPTLMWAVQLIPSMILLHFVSILRRVFRRDEGSFALWLLALPGYLLTIPLALLIMVLVEVFALLLAVLAILPIGPLRSFIASMQMLISNWVGDIYMLITSPLRRAAMMAQIRRELRWLEERCETIAIVAHSQGAALSYYVLRENKPEAVARLLTFGSAVKLMENITFLRQSRKFLSILICLALLAGSAILGLIYVRDSFLPNILNSYDPVTETWDIDSVGVVLGLLFILMLLYSLILWLGILVAPILARDLKLDDDQFHSDKDFKWIDFYTMDDPAPNGPLLEKDLPKYFDSREVHNSANLVTDHSTYWHNYDEFIPAVACALSELSEIKLSKLTKKDPNCLAETAARRGLRVRWLVRSRIVLALSAIFMLVAFRGSYLAIGAPAASALQSLPAWLPMNASIESTLAGVKSESFGIAILLAISLLLYIPMLIVWKWWEFSDVEGFFLRKVPEREGALFGVFKSLAIILIVTTLLLSLASINQTFFRDVTGSIWQNGRAILTILLAATLGFCILSWLIMWWLYGSDWKGRESQVLLIPLRAALLSAPLTIWGTIYPAAGWVAFVGLIMLLIFLLLYDRYVGTASPLTERVNSWFRRRRKNPVANSIPVSHLDRLRRFQAKVYEFSPGLLSLLLGFLAFGLNLRGQAGGSLQAGWTVVSSFFAVYFGIQRADASAHRILQLVSILGILLGILGCITPLVLLP